MNEKEKDIRLLLDRFMAGETSLEEEALIGEWFRQHPDVSDVRTAAFVCSLKKIAGDYISMGIFP